MAFSLASITKKIVNTIIAIVKVVIPFSVAPQFSQQVIAYTPFAAIPLPLPLPSISSLDFDDINDEEMDESRMQEIVPTNTHAKLLFAHAKALINAAQNRDTAAAIELIATGAPVNVRDSAGNSPLKAAIQTDNVELILALIQAGAYIPEAKLKNTQRSTRASAQNHTAFMPSNKSWLDQALLAAIQYKNTQAINALIEANANVNTTDSKGNTALMLAVCQDDFFSVDILIKAGANLTAQNAIGKTALMLATHHAHHHTQKEIVFRLLSALPNQHGIPIQSNPLNALVRQYQQKLMQIRGEVFSVVGALGIINKNQPILPRVLMSMVLSHSDLYPRWYHAHIQQDMRNITKIVNKIVQKRQQHMLLLRDARPKAVKRKMPIDNA